MKEHYYSENPESEIKEITFDYQIKNVSLKFTSVSGVFSFKNKIDKASELLIKSFYPSGKMLLDMGCGYGAIGLFLKALFPNLLVVLSDINNRAVEYSILNARNNNLQVKVIQSNLFSNLSGLRFDDIVTNPPIAAGKKLNTDLINKSHDYLNTGGALWLVAYHNKGGSTYKNIMKERFGNVEDIEKSGGIRVYKSIKL
ncbi:MAG TPA: class I SAM-dependent methyltransferase [Clostridiaceae bacterium]|nr:class I SAM-dependent methyltransferase [Clostridiaceae bacterium]